MTWKRSGVSSSRVSDLRCGPARFLSAAAVLAALVLFAGPGLQAAGDPGYVLITRDGHRIDVRERPAIVEGRLRVHLHPGGMLAMVDDGMIDWPATEEYNARREAAAAPRPKARQGRALAGAVPRALPGDVREMRIVGSKFGVVRGGSGEDEESEGARGRPAVETDPAKAAARLAELQREFANLRSHHDDAVQSRDKLRQQIADLESRVSRDPPASSVQQYQSPSERALEEARTSLESVEAQIALLESRMSDVRFQAVMLGGAVD